jgi:hypothetical protein
MASHLRAEGPLLLRHLVVPMPSAPFGDSLEAAPQALLHRLDVDRELPSPAPHALVREAEEVEGFGFGPIQFRLSSYSASGRITLPTYLTRWLVVFLAVCAMANLSESLEASSLAQWVLDLAQYRSAILAGWLFLLVREPAVQRLAAAAGDLRRWARVST